MLPTRVGSWAPQTFISHVGYAEPGFASFTFLLIKDLDIAPSIAEESYEDGKLGRRLPGIRAAVSLRWLEKYCKITVIASRV